MDLIQSTRLISHNCRNGRQEIDYKTKDKTKNILPFRTFILNLGIFQNTQHYYTFSVLSDCLSVSFTAGLSSGFSSTEAWPPSGAGFSLASVDIA